MASETSSSAVLSPKRRVRRRTSTIGWDCGACQLGEGAAGDAGGAIAFGENFHPLAAGERRTLFGDIGAGGAAFFDDAGRFELAVRAGDRVGVNEQPLSENANRRQLLAGRESAGGDQVFHLGDDLEVDRDAIGGGNVDLHGVGRPASLVLMQ
jgi:hypothetical protein